MLELLQTMLARSSVGRLRWRANRLPPLIILLILHLARPAFAQPEPAGVAVADKTPWPVLDDGRVVLTIFDVKIAMPTCAQCLDYRFRTADANGHDSGRYAPTVRDVIAHPERLRYIADNSDQVRLEMGNDWRPEANRGPFLGRVDPKSLPSSTRMWLIVYRHSRAEPCWTGSQPDVECLAVHHMDTADRHDDQVVAGMNVIKGPFSYDPPGQIGGFALPIRYSFYLAPTDHARDAIGLPVRVQCDPLKTCENSAFGAGRGFALRRDVDLFFTFREERYAPGEWITLHDRTMDAVRALLLNQ